MIGIHLDDPISLTLLCATKYEHTSTSSPKSLGSITARKNIKNDRRASPTSLTVKSPIFVNKIGIRFKTSIVAQKPFLLRTPCDENSNHLISIPFIVSTILATYKSYFRRKVLTYMGRV